MEKLIVINTRDVKEITTQIQEQWGCTLSLPGAFFKSVRDKIYYADKGVGLIDWKHLKVNSIGMYFADVHRGVRLSIEGSQLVGPQAKKGVVLLTDKEAQDWMQGLDLDKECNEEGFVILQHNKDFLGCGKAMPDKILNYVPKVRRLLVK